MVVTALRAGRGSLHRFSVEVLTQAELRDGLLLYGAGLLVLPLPPEQGAARLPAVNPSRLWGPVVLFMALQAAEYVALCFARSRLAARSCD